MEPDEIKALIEASGLKIGEIESQIGLAQSTLSKVIKGTRSLNAKKLSALKRICNKAIKDALASGKEIAWQITENNLPENKEQIEKERNQVNINKAQYPLTPEECFKPSEEKVNPVPDVPDVPQEETIKYNTVAEALNSPYPPAKAEGTITSEDIDNLVEAVTYSQLPAIEVPPVPAVTTIAIDLTIYDLGQRFKTLCEAIAKNPEDVLNDISNRWIADTPPVVIAHEDDVREFPRPDSSLFKFL